MNRKLIVLFVLASLLLASVGQSASAQQAQLAIPVLVANTSFLNVRSGDGPQYSVVVTVVGGTELPVLGKDAPGTWFLVTTPVGPGWVDVSFTLARGDFSIVPVLKPTFGAPVQLPTPLTIGLPLAYYQTPLTVTPQTMIQSSTVAILNVLSVNLRTQPAEDAPVIGVLFRYADVSEFAVVGYAYDSVGIPWVAIVAPDLGTGWIEAPKTTIQAGTVPSTVTATNPSTTVPLASLEVPHVVVNTSFQNIRFGPGAQFAVIATVPGGTSLDTVGVNSDESWFEVQGDFGLGWINSQYVLFRGTIGNVPIIHNAY